MSSGGGSYFKRNDQEPNVQVNTFCNEVHERQEGHQHKSQDWS